MGYSDKVCMASIAYITLLLFFYSASVVEESFNYLDAPVERIAGADVCMPYAANLERMAVPQVDYLLYFRI